MLICEKRITLGPGQFLVEKIEGPEPAHDRWYVRLPLHISLSSLLTQCLTAGLGMSFISSKKGKSPTKSELNALKMTFEQFPQYKRISDQFDLAKKQVKVFLQTLQTLIPQCSMLNYNIIGLLVL